MRRDPETRALVALQRDILAGIDRAIAHAKPSASVQRELLDTLAIDGARGDAARCGRCR